MFRNENLVKLRHLVIKTKKALSGSASGVFKSKFRGPGYEFEQLREYRRGDDVRFIDWKGSARTTKTLFRECRDERNRTMHILLDISGSMLYGTQKLYKYDVMVELAAALTLIGESSRDAVGLFFLGEGSPGRMGAKVGKKQTANIFNKLVNNSMLRTKVAIGPFIKNFINSTRKKSLVFVISDFIDASYQKPLSILSRMHEVILVRVRDSCEESVFESVASIVTEDAESNSGFQIKSGAHAKKLSTEIKKFNEEQSKFFKRLNLPLLDVSTDGVHIQKLVEFLETKN